MTTAKSLIALLPALLVAAGYFAARWSAANPDYTHPATVVLLALVISQLGLLAVWCGLSRRTLWIRLPLTLLGIACVGLVLVCGRGWHVRTRATSDFAIYPSEAPCEHCARGQHSTAKERDLDAVMGLAAPLVAGAVFVFLRWQARLSLVSSRQPTQIAHKPLQFTTSHLLLAVTALATLLGGVPWLADQPFSRLLPPRVVIGLLFVLVTLGSVWASLGQTRPLLRLAMLVPTVAALAFAMIWPVRMASGGLTDALSLAMAATAGLAAVLLGGVLLIFRLRGYRVTRAEPLPIPVHSRNLWAALAAVCAVVSVTIAPAAYRNWQEARAAHAIVVEGEHVRYEKGKVVSATLTARSGATAQWLAHLRHLEEVGFNASEIADDDDLVYIKNLANLKRLWVAGSPITDEGLKHLVGLKNLEELNVSHTQVTNVGMQYLTALPRLRLVNVTGTSVNATGAKYLNDVRPNVVVRGVSTQ